jgi:dTDP-4-dehydrorhamnose reductase
MRVLITGGTGQLGRALSRLAPEGVQVTALGSSQCDITDPAAVWTAVTICRPDVVVHCAAMTDVDGCEHDPRRAWRVNALGTQHVAAAAMEAGARLVYISTNYVFDGEAEEPYHEFARPNPISVYGATKLAGEEIVRALCPRHYVVRTAMLYDETGRNFVTTILRLACERPALQMVADQIGNPTYAADLAAAIWRLVGQPAYGTYHLVNAGHASWFEWACEAVWLAGLSTPVEPIPASAYRRAARPPRNGTLASLAAPALGISLPPWQDALRRNLERRAELLKSSGPR